MDKLDNQGTIENYKALMSAIIQRQVEDYKDLLLGFVKDGDPAPGSSTTLTFGICESFFKSDWYAHLAGVIGLDLSGDDIIEACKKTTKDVYVRYRTTQGKDGKWYVYYYSPNFPMTKNRHNKEYYARQEAAELCGFEARYYTRLIERDKKIFGKDSEWKNMIRSRKN